MPRDRPICFEGIAAKDLSKLSKETDIESRKMFSESNRIESKKTQQRTSRQIVNEKSIDWLELQITWSSLVMNSSLIGPTLVNFALTNSSKTEKR